MSKKRNAWAKFKTRNRHVDLRGPILHDGSHQKKDIPYSQYLFTKHWIVVRRLALERANHRCSICESTHSLQVHHLTYDNLWHEYANDLTVLCDSCHTMLHASTGR